MIAGIKVDSFLTPDVKSKNDVKTCVKKLIDIIPVIKYPISACNHSFKFTLYHTETIINSF